jgi:2'-5' RNA ligase
MKRTFIAVPVEVSENLRHLLNRLKQELRRDSIKWVDPEDTHITIKFLGDTPEDTIEPISDKLQLISEKFRFSTGRIEGLDIFTNNGMPTVLYTRFTDLPMLQQLARLLNEELKTLGFLPENRDFKPHLTLARIKHTSESKNYYNLVKTFGNTEIQHVNIEKLILFESMLLPTGPKYKPLKTIILKKPEIV